MVARAPTQIAVPTASPERRSPRDFRSSRGLAAIAALLGLSACTVGPDYLRPEAPVSTQFKELKGWKQARPRDAIEKGNWWAIFRDPELDRLASQVSVTNQNVAMELAAYEQAKSPGARNRRPACSRRVAATWSGQRSGATAISGVGPPSPRACPTRRAA